ncbi:MAG: helix-turn-helix transcriptional regulator [Crocosphaera sp.]|nr:helix-turn-helix transcriptional regulator [Crocosphaera sp.]
MPKKKVTVKKAQSKIKKLREDQNLTQAQLAVFIGVTSNTIQNWEKNVGLDQLEKYIKLCTILNCKIEDLIDYVEDEVDVETVPQSKGFSVEELRDLQKRWEDTKTR